MNKKGGFELSISFLVGIILGIVLLSLGLIFVYNILTSTDEIRRYGLPSFFEMEADNCVQNNERVCVPIIKKDAETTDTASFGVVINNNYGEEKEFQINVQYSRGFLDDGTEVPVGSIDVSEWTFSDYDVITLDNFEYEIIEVPMRVPSNIKAGNYVFNVNVCFNGPTSNPGKCSGSYPTLYDNTVQVTVTVVA